MRWLVYPVVMGSALAGTLLALRVHLPPAMVLGAVTLGTVAVLFVWELGLPYSVAWATGRGDTQTDLAFAAASAVGAELLSLVIPIGIIVAGLSHGPIARLGWWPASAPLLVQGGLALLLTELYAYWLHRWMHRVPWLWRLHAIHHSVPRVYVLNALRMHPLDNLLTGLAFVPPALLGATPESLTLVGAFSSAHALLQHVNTPVASGPLDWLFSTPALHRWHHSRVLKENDANFGGVLVLWDLLFGTRLLPPRPPPEDVGLMDLPSFPIKFWAQLVAPLRREPWRPSPRPEPRDSARG